jgi:hypothetical protein
MIYARIGFTGTREGLTKPQRKMLEEQIAQLYAEGLRVVHHGCCIGADVEFHDLVWKIPGIRIEGHPSTFIKFRADVKCMEQCAILYPPAPPLTRNKDIVNSTQLLLAAPAQHTEVLRSGTWSTIRYAHYRIPVRIITPAGTTYTRRNPS